MVFRSSVTLKSWCESDVGPDNFYIILGVHEIDVHLVLTTVLKRLNSVPFIPTTPLWQDVFRQIVFPLNHKNEIPSDQSKSRLKVVALERDRSCFVNKYDSILNKKYDTTDISK